MNVQDRYTYRVRFSDEDGRFVASVAELPSLSWLDDTPDAALNGLRGVVGEALDDMRASHEPVPEPIAERDYSGHFTLRLTREQHRQLALQAAEQHVSINKLAASRVLANTVTPA